jgi:hypothetical protein
MPKQWFYDRHDVPVPEADEDVIAPPVAPAPVGPAFAKDAVVDAASRAEPTSRDKLLNNVIEDVTGVSEQWLAPVKPAFMQLVNKALSDDVSDEDLEQAITRAADTMPEMFDQLNTKALQEAMERIKNGITVQVPNFSALKLDSDAVTDVLTIGARATSNYLKKFYREKDSKEPNKLGGRRTHFWNRQVGGNVQTPKTEGDKVIVAIDNSILPHKVKGGTIKAKRTKYLTIPLIAEAYAKPARSFDDLIFIESKKGNKLLAKPEKKRSTARKFNPKSEAKKRKPNTRRQQRSQQPLGLRVDRPSPQSGKRAK